MFPDQWVFLGRNATTLLASSFDRCALSDFRPKSALAYRPDAFFLANAETGKACRTWTTPIATDNKTQRGENRFEKRLAIAVSRTRPVAVKTGYVPRLCGA